MANDEDIENDLDDFDDGGFEELNGKGTLADLWRNNPFVKIAVIIGAFVFIVAGIILFGGKEERTPTSRTVGAAESVSEAPGSSDVSEAYRQAVEETNQVATEEALRNSTSAVPMPVAPALGVIPQTVDPNEEEDPLDRWRRMQEERMNQQDLTVEPVQQEPEVDTRTPAVNALSQAMSQQMESVLAVQGVKGSQVLGVTNMRYLEELRMQEQRELEEAMQHQAALGSNNLQPTAEVVVPAGTIEYAQLITEANTDAPGPVLAEIASGPLQGSRIIGSFSSTDQDYLTLNFSTVVVNGISQSVSAVALDPNTTLPGMVTDIDKRYFKRVVLPAAAAFVEGLTSAIAESGRTTVTISGAAGTTTTQTTGNTDNDQEVASGIEKAGETLSDIFDEEADRTRVMLKIASGTPIGILFMQPVMDRPIVQPITNNAGAGLPQQTQQPYFFVPSAAGTGQQGQMMNYTGQQQNVGSQ